MEPSRAKSILRDVVAVTGRELVTVGPHGHAHWPAIRVGLSATLPLAACLAAGHPEWSPYAGFGAMSSIFGRHLDYGPRARAQAGTGFALATEVADHLARKGVPFAEAHEITGALVRYCEEMGRELETLDGVDLRAVDPRLDAGVLDHLTLDAAVAARSGHGGTAPDRVREQLARLRELLVEQDNWAQSYDGPRG